jgi:uncharacterized protein with ParB-like and HNH nuclease domain
MQSGSSKIFELFNGDKIFNVPKYQRAYTWQKENLADFLDDLINHRGDKEYFLGTFLFHQQSNRGEYEIVDIVDGQQRLTTIILFQKELIEILGKGSQKVSNKTFYKYIKDRDGVYKLELDNDDDTFLHNLIDDEDIDSTETPSQKNLLFSKSFFHAELKKLSTEKLEHIYETLINAEIILYIVNKISDATQIFELLNDRGRGLTNLEGIKSFLMYKISSLKLKDFEQPINDIQGNFSSIYRIIEQNSINENDVLRYHTITFEKTKAEDYNKSDKFIKNKINREFDNSTNDDIIKNEILSYVKRLKRSFDIYKEIKQNSLASEHLDKLVMVGRVNPFFPFLMKVYNDDKVRFDEFVSILLKFTFKATFIGLQNRNEKFYRYIRNNNNLFDAFKWPIQDNWWNINNRFTNVLSYRNYFDSVNKNMVKYILFEYENSLRQEKGYPILTINNYFESNERRKISIEHITAQKCKNLHFDDDFKENYLHSLGNLVLDNKSSNSRKGNNAVQDKIEEYNKAPIMSQNEINDKGIDWDKLEEVKLFIDKRNEDLLNYIRKNFG